MSTYDRNEILSRSSWTIPLAICCTLFVSLLIAATIVLGLIPVYLSSPSVDIEIDTSENETIFNAIYASDVIDGRLLTVSTTNDLYTQMLNGIPNLQHSMNIESAQFLPATATVRKKRQISNGMTCEQPTGLLNDLFTTQYKLKYPSMYLTLASRRQYLSKVQNAIRKIHRRKTVVITLSNGTTRSIQLAFCGLSTEDLSTYIHLLDQDSNFFKFNPFTFDVKFVGKINCSTTANPYSLALQRDGKAWTLFTDGNLYTFDTKTALCQTTSYVSQQEGLILFGMKFITGKSSNTEKLYISSDSSNPPYRLGTIDVNTLKVSITGYYNNIVGRGELTSSYDRRLFGLFEGTPYIVAEINQTNAAILSKTSLDMIQYTPDSSYFAFESYLSNFFLFIGDNTYTDIFLYDLSSKSVTRRKTISYGIVGAAIPTYTRVANISNQDWGFWRKIKYCFQDFNLFPSAPPSTNKCELAIQRTSTILFLILLIALLIVPFFFYSFGMDANDFQTVSIPQPSLNTYMRLHSTYPLTLTCTCTQMSIKYERFIHIEHALHHVCNSIFVTDEWINHISGSNGATLNGDDFRVTGPYTFQALRMFCELSHKTVLDNLLRFYSTQYISISVIPETLFQTQIDSIIDQLLLSSANSFLLSLSMIQGTTQVNALFSGLQTNYRLYNENHDNRVFVAAKNYNGCSCDRSANCIQQSSIYNNASATKLFVVPGFYTGCSVIESLLQSNLQCLYTQTCIDALQTYLSSSSIHVPPLNSLLDRYSVDSTIKILLDQLMVDKWNMRISYANYYDQCQPAQCTYTYAKETKLNATYIAIIILFLLGGPLFVLKLVISLLTKVVICCTRKSTRQVVPPALIAHT